MQNSSETLFAQNWEHCGESTNDKGRSWPRPARLNSYEEASEKMTAWKETWKHVTVGDRPYSDSPAVKLCLNLSGVTPSVLPPFPMPV